MEQPVGRRSAGDIRCEGVVIMGDVQSYLEKLKIKKSLVGGFDPEAVYAAMQEFSSLYEEQIRQMKEEKERLAAECRKVSGELEEANREIQALKFRLKEGQKNQVQYELKFNALTQAIEAVNAGRDGVLEESRRMAGAMVAEADRKLESARRECRLQEEQKKLLLSEIAEARQRFGLSVKGLRSTLTRMLSEIDSLQDGGMEPASGGACAAGKPGGGAPAGAEDEAGRLVWMLAGSVGSHDR